MAKTGDRITEANPKYIQHPDWTSQMWQDGSTLDSGTAIIIENNLNHLHEESCRQLVTAVCAELDALQDDFRDFTGYNDAGTPVDFSVVGDENQISWGSRSAFRFGPFQLIADQTNEGQYSPESFPRTIRIILNIYNDSSTMYGYCYLTQDPGRPSAGNYLAKSVFSDSTVGEFNKIVDLTPATNQVNGAVFPGYIWVGIRFGATGGQVLSVSAFEIR